MRESGCVRQLRLNALRKARARAQSLRNALRPKSSRERLLYKLSTTAAARYGAANRLEARERRLTRLTAFSSAYLIVLTVLPYFLGLEGGVEDRINLIAATFAVIVLASSLLQAGSGNSARAEQLHRSGMEISAIERELALEDTLKATKRANKEYSMVLEKYSVNHGQLDIDLVMIKRPHEFPWLRGTSRLRRYVAYWIGDALPNLFLLGVTGSFLALIFLYALPRAPGGFFGLPD